MAASIPFDENVLKLDVDQEIEHTSTRIRQLVAKRLKRRGLVVALSGGIDSSVTTALAVRALGPERVLALLMPEKHSSPETVRLSLQMADSCEVQYLHENITPVLEALDFYGRYDKAVRRVVPDVFSPTED